MVQLLSQAASLVFTLPLVVAAADVPFVTLNNGVKMPAIAAGSWQYTNDTATIAVGAALEAGFRHVDCAHDYCGDGSTGDCKSESNQRGVGAAIRASGVPRDEVFVTTKVPGCGLQGIGRSSCAADSVAAAKENLEELGLAHTDLLLVHFPPTGGCGALNCPLIKAQWKALSEEILAANLTRALGVSNFCVSCIKCLLDSDDAASVVTPAVNQIEYHVGMGADPEGLLSYCGGQNIVVEAYSPLGDNTTELITGNLTTSIGKIHNKTSVQVALRWIYENGHVLTTKSTKPEHLAQDLDIFSWSLTADEKAQLDASTTPSGKPSFMCSS